MSSNYWPASGFLVKLTQELATALNLTEEEFEQISREIREDDASGPAIEEFEKRFAKNFGLVPEYYYEFYEEDILPDCYEPGDIGILFALEDVVTYKPKWKKMNAILSEQHLDQGYLETWSRWG
jgi:hypothetical protein